MTFSGYYIRRFVPLVAYGTRFPDRPRAVGSRRGVHLALMAGTESMNVQHFEIEPGAVVEEHSHPTSRLAFCTRVS